MLRIDHLNLHESYEFDVIVHDERNNFAGKLSLSLKKCTILISGEQTLERKYSSGWADREELICRDLNKTFILKNLSIHYVRQRAIQAEPCQIGFFEVEFTIGFVLFLPLDRASHVSISSISIHSSLIGSWIGSTIKQESIVTTYSQGGLARNHDEILTEFFTKAGNNSIMVAHYKFSWQRSPHEFKSGIFFPPCLTTNYHTPIPSSQARIELEKIYNLFSLLVGGDFAPEKIEIYCTAPGLQKAGSFYMPVAHLAKKDSRRAILFPLGKDLRFDQLGLPSFPLEAINAYFCMTVQDLEIWGKYSRYRKLENPEERFLGYFRLLERLCFKQKTFLDEPKLSALIIKAKPYMTKRFGDKKSVTSFLNGIPRYNSSKYNTSKCIQDFYTSIPKELTSTWKLQKTDIDKICKIRNDISHANDFLVSDDFILECESFAHALLLISMLKKIGIDIETSSKIISRMPGYHFIRSA